MSRMILLTNGVMITPQPQIDVDGLDWMDATGIIPTFLHRNNPAPPVEQLRDAYGHWRPMDGWTYDKTDNSITYLDGETVLGAEKYLPWVELQLLPPDGENVVPNPCKIFIYRHAWVCIVQPDGTFEVSRMD